MSSYYTNKPIEKALPVYGETVSEERKNLLLGVPIHAIEEKKFFAVKGERVHMNYDTDCLLLTDGEYSPNNDYRNKEWFHIHGGGGRIITFKLPYLCAVDGFSFNTCRHDEVGVRSPIYVKMRVSADGENFETVYENNDTRSSRDLHIHKITGKFNKVKALYVQLALEVTHHVYIDELEIFGCTDLKNAREPVNDGKCVFNDSPSPDEINEYPPEDILGAKNIVLAYNYRPVDENKGLLTYENFLPMTAYLDKDGNITDTFMDGFLFLPDVSFEFSPFGKRSEGWRDYMDSIFAPDKNLNALEKAAYDVGNKLNIPDYKVKVFFPIPYTYTGPEEFGMVNGENLVFDNPESRKKAIKWLIDSLIERYNGGNYPHTELEGFYWFEEALNVTDKYEKEIVRFACDYLKEKGLKCFWIPYFCALGYEEWQSYGFTAACMQPNYMFDYSIHKDRLYETAKQAHRMGMCVELEVWKIYEDEKGNIDDDSRENIRRFIEYLEAGKETGYMKTAKMYYQGSAHGCIITRGWNSKNEYYREMYDKAYLFAKKKL